MSSPRPTAAPGTTTPGASGARPAPGLSRALDVLLAVSTLATVPAVVWGGSDGEHIGRATVTLALVSLVWTGLGLVWTAVRLRRVHRAGRGDPGWPQRLLGPRTVRWLTVGTALIVVNSGLNITVLQGDDANTVVSRTLAMLTVLVAWSVLHLAYAERYARMVLDDPHGAGHLDFPGTTAPTLLEFAYLAFSVGTTFGTSDVTVRTSRMRGVVMCHGLLAFVYNTAVLGMVLGLIAG